MLRKLSPYILNILFFSENQPINSRLRDAMLVAAQHIGWCQREASTCGQKVFPGGSHPDQVNVVHDLSTGTIWRPALVSNDLEVIIVGLERSKLPANCIPVVKNAILIYVDHLDLFEGYSSEPCNILARVCPGIIFKSIVGTIHRPIAELGCRLQWSASHPNEPWRDLVILKSCMYILLIYGAICWCWHDTIQIILWLYKTTCGRKY